MSSPVTAGRSTGLVLENNLEALVAMRRMLELAEERLPQLCSARELSGQQAARLATELGLIRRSLDALASNPGDAAAAAHVRKTVLVLDSTVGSRLWVLDAATGEEWRACRGKVFRGCSRDERGVRGRLGRDQLRALQDLLELARLYR